ncbi:MAG: magnesium transporter CorA family protein [Spirochaetia bacterium]|nr:magnesium transporter CorA family protein [Spirochaetia bacterium]
MNFMVKIFKISDKGFTEIPEIEKNCWVNISNPLMDDLDGLSKKFNIPLDFLTDSLDVDEKSRIEAENDCTFFIIRTPVYNKEKADVPFTTLPVGIVIQQDIIVTICFSDTAEILELFHEKAKNISMKNKYRFILHLLQKTNYFYLKYLKEINRKTDDIETELQRATKNVELIKLLNIEKSLVFFTTSLSGNKRIIERLQKVFNLELSDEDRDFLDDLIIDNRQAIEMVNIYSNILSGMMDAFASVISNNLNIVLKYLTSVTIILMIPTLMASIYGMNINLPFQHSPHAFLITMAFSFGLSSIGVLVFLRKRWF